MQSVSMTSSSGTYDVDAISEVLIFLWHCRSLPFDSWTVECMLNLVFLLKKSDNGLFGAAKLYCYIVVRFLETCQIDGSFSL